MSDAEPVLEVLDAISGLSRFEAVFSTREEAERFYEWLYTHDGHDAVLTKRDGNLPTYWSAGVAFPWAVRFRAKYDLYWDWFKLP